MSVNNPPLLGVIDTNYFRKFHSKTSKVQTFEMNDRNHFNISHAPLHSFIEKMRIQMRQTHLLYLSYLGRENEELKVKSELCIKMENSIKEYLYVVQHDHKFEFAEFSHCLLMTLKKTNFNIEKAFLAFEALERYATNLLSYPWRHEFRTIFAFSGYFHRIIDASLVGYQEIFECMGYRFDSQTSVYSLIEIPIDPDKITEIALECLMVIVELRIMSEIKSRCSEVSWIDIFFVRNDYVCNIERAVEILNEKKLERLIDFDLPDYKVEKFHKLDLLSLVEQAKECKVQNHDDVSFSELIPPPSNYLESNLDVINFVDLLSSRIQMENVGKIHLQSNFSKNNLNGKRIIQNKQTSQIKKDIDIQIADFLVPETSTSADSFLKNEVDNQKNIQLKHSSDLKIDETHKSSIFFEYSNDCEKILKEKPTEFIENSQNNEQKQFDNSKFNKWPCAYCTFINIKQPDICEMCHRSRIQGNELNSLVSGGRECNQCTLVNNKNEKFCKACGTSLADSPTYI